MVTAYTGATIIDGKGGIVPNGTIVVASDRIAAAGPSHEVAVPPGAETVDLTGRYVIPGLIDAHVHVCFSGRPDYVREMRRLTTFLSVEAAVNAFKCLCAGFTSLRDAGAPAMVDFGVKQAIEEKVITGPRMQVCGGFLSITGGHGDPEAGWPPEFSISGYTVVDGVDEARKAARLQLRYGADALKVGATGGVLSEGDLPTARGLTEEEIRAVVEEGLNVGKKTLAHAQGHVGIENAIRAGVASIEHGSLLRDETIELMLKHDVFLVPTLTAVFHIIERGAEGGIPEESVNKAKMMAEPHRENFLKAYRAGVKIAMGTDAGTPFNYHGDNALELVLMTKAGMTPMDAIVASTSRAAELMDWEDRVGALEPGRFADMVVLKADPVSDISVLTKPDQIESVFLGGRRVTGMVPA